MDTIEYIESLNEQQRLALRLSLEEREQKVSVEMACTIRQTLSALDEYENKDCPHCG